MVASGIDGSITWLLVAAAALLGLVLSPLAETLIAKRLPRLGGLPTVPVRISTAAITAVLCVAFSLRFGLGFALPAFLFLAILGVQLSRIDIALHLLPN
ncbi:MAG: prepilin peptidase, partial [Pseudarthrobacter sp.]